MALVHIYTILTIPQLPVGIRRPVQHFTVDRAKRAALCHFAQCRALRGPADNKYRANLPTCDVAKRRQLAKK
jgi:hypothetical protein